MINLYTAAVCPFAHRSRLALTAKQIDHQRHEIDLANMPAWYKELCPTANVPMLDVEGRHIWESAIINEFLEEVYPDHPLWPRDPFLKARGRIALDAAGNGLIPSFYKALRGEITRPDEHFLQVFADLEASMVGEGPFWLGNQLSLTDIAIYPWFERWPALTHCRRVGLPQNARVSRWKDAMAAHPAVIQERCDQELYIQAYARHASTPAQ